LVTDIPASIICWMPRALGVGEVPLLIVGDDLVHDAVDDLLAGIGSGRRQHVDRNAGQADFAGCKGAPLAVADVDDLGPLGVANTRDRHQDTVFGDVGDERLAQGCVVADIVTDVEQRRVKVFQRPDRLVSAVGRAFGVGCVGHG
jgi:hypothetical protein